MKMASKCPLTYRGTTKALATTKCVTAHRPLTLSLCMLCEAAHTSGGVCGVTESEPENRDSKLSTGRWKLYPKHPDVKCNTWYRGIGFQRIPSPGACSKLLLGGGTMEGRREEKGGWGYMFSTDLFKSLKGHVEKQIPRQLCSSDQISKRIAREKLVAKRS